MAKALLPLTLALLLAFASSAAPKAAQTPYDSALPATVANEIDKLVFAQLKEKGIVPANLCSDSVFLRRAYLDVIGTLPTAAEARDFLADRTPDKRARLIDRLLGRDEFADYWAMKWSDLLRVKAEFPINLWPNAAQAYHHWIRASVRENKPLDRFARELLTASGSNFREPPVNFYRAMQNRQPQGIAQTVALTFMGVRTEKWSAEELAGMAAFFSQLAYKETGEWKEEILFFDPGLTNAPKKARFCDGTWIDLPGGEDPRAIFANWLVSPENRWFARSMANRTWAWLIGRGVIHEPDDMRPDNPPCNSDLLSFLEKELIKSHYDQKALFRLILNSSTYQLSPVSSMQDNPAEMCFAHYLVRRLDAEVLIDALNQITGTSEKYSSPIPEPFTYIPESQRSIALPDGSISSAFLELFGRPPRDTGTEGERNNRITAAQRLHLLNSSQIQQKLERSRFVQNLTLKSDGRQVVTGLYLSILSRYPTEQELLAVASYSRSGVVKGREAIVDVAWALINSAEFMYRH